MTTQTSTAGVPPAYDADVDEMTAGGLAVLAELRRRMLSVGMEASVLRVVDAYAAEIAADATTEDTDDTRLCLVADFDADVLRTALMAVEELLGTIARWERDPEVPADERWRAPDALRGLAAEQAIERLRQALETAETRSEYHDRQMIEVPPAGPRWQTTGGYQLAALTFVGLPVDDLAVLADIADALTRADNTLTDAVEATQDFLGQPDTDRDQHGIVATTTRLHALLSLEPDDDTELLRRAALAAGDTVVLDRAQEAAWHRVATRLHAAFQPHDALNRWVMGSSDHL